LYYRFKKGGPSRQGLGRNEFLLLKTTQFSDLKQLANAIMKYVLRSSFIIRITHLEGEEIFGFCNHKPDKHKLNLLPWSNGDSHWHNHVNFYYPHLDAQNGKFYVHIEWHDWYEHVDIIDEGVEVLKASCGDDVWHI